MCKLEVGVGRGDYSHYSRSWHITLCLDVYDVLFRIQRSFFNLDQFRSTTTNFLARC